MSEHLGIKGNIEYYHLPYGEKGSFSYCHHCKRTCDKALVEFHQGWVNDWIKFVCGHCKKTIWVSQLCSEEDFSAEERRKMVEDNLKCIVCLKPTNSYDMDCYTIDDNEEIVGLCSECSYEDYFDLLNTKKMAEELRLNIGEQKLKINIKDFRRIIRTICSKT